MKLYSMLTRLMLQMTLWYCGLELTIRQLLLQWMVLLIIILPP